MLISARFLNISLQSYSAACILNVGFGNDKLCFLFNTVQWILFFSPCQTLLMMLFAGRDGQTTCTAGKVKTLSSFLLSFFSEKMHDCEGKGLLGELDYSVHMKTQILCAESLWKPQTSDYAKTPASCCIWAVEKLAENDAFDIVGVSKWAKWGRSLSSCCNTAWNAEIQMTAWEQEDLSRWKM